MANIESRRDAWQDEGSAAFWREPARLDHATRALGDTPDAADFGLLADHLPILCWMARPDGHIIWYNRGWLDYCGVTQEDMRGWGWTKVHDPEVLPQVMDRWRESLARGTPFEMVFPLRGADGQLRPFLTRARPLHDADGAIRQWFGVNTEVGAQLRAEAALSDSEARYRVLTEAMPQMVWSTLPDGFHDYYNDQWYRFTGVPHGSTDGEGWKDMFHPDDQERARERWQHSLETGETYEIEYRLRHRSGTYRWTLGRALPVRDANGAIVRWIGTCTDIHDARMAAEQNEILSRELSHRIKNIFAVVTGLVSLSGRREPQSSGFAAKLVDRIMALGRAHEFARPHSERSRPQNEEETLSGMLGQILAPYQINEQQRIRIKGDEVQIDDQSATPIALIFHELATNAAKYGALATDEGRVDLTIGSSEGNVRIEWIEHGGPPVAGAPDHSGFGSRLAEMSATQQLGGHIRRDWRPDGLHVTLDVPAARLRRR